MSGLRTRKERGSHPRIKPKLGKEGTLAAGVGVMPQRGRVHFEYTPRDRPNPEVRRWQRERLKGVRWEAD